MPAGSSLPFDPLDLVLHIGSGKTGTSSIQFFLHRNRGRLAELDTLYPRSPGKTRHVRLGLFVKSDDAFLNSLEGRNQKAPTPERFRSNFQRRLFKEIGEAGCGRLVLSDEALYGAPEDALGRLRQLTDRIAGRLRIVVYLRRQDDHMCSRYQEVVKTGETRRMADRLPRLDLSRTSNYHARLLRWRELLEPGELVVRPFERERFPEGSLLQDFVDAAGVPVRVDDLDQTRPVNESLDAEAVEFFRILNLVRVEEEGMKPGLIRNRPLAAKLARTATGPTLTLPEPVLDEFMEQWEDSNRAVAREFLDEGGELFHSPRKTRNTTTEQRLEPSRVDHYVELLELDDHLRAPLRRTAEREARG